MLPTEVRLMVWKEAMGERHYKVTLADGLNIRHNKCPTYGYKRPLNYKDASSHLSVCFEAARTVALGEELPMTITSTAFEEVYRENTRYFRPRTVPPAPYDVKFGRSDMFWLVDLEKAAQRLGNRQYFNQHLIYILIREGCLIILLWLLYLFMT